MYKWLVNCHMATYNTSEKTETEVRISLNIKKNFTTPLFRL